MASEDYVIEIHSNDWFILLNELALDVAKDQKDVEAHVQVGVSTEGIMTLLIKKDWLPAERFALLIGSTAEAVLQANKITLQPLKGTDTWQTPTVSYYGFA